MWSTTFNFLLVALVVALVDAAPRPDMTLPIAGSPGAELVGLLPEVTHSHFSRGVADLMTLAGRDYHPKATAESPIIHSTGSKQKNRRMVYGWTPKSFEDGDNDQSNWELLATRPGETSELPPQDNKKGHPAGMNSTLSGSKGQPPAAVLKTLCDLLLSGHNSSDASGSLDASLPSASSTAGDNKDPGSNSTGSLADNTTGIADGAHNSTQPLDQSSSMPAGAGSELAMTWCNQHFGDPLSANSDPHQVPTINDDNSSASGISTLPFSAGQTSKSSHPQSSHSLLPEEGTRHA